MHGVVSLSVLRWTYSEVTLIGGKRLLNTRQFRYLFWIFYSNCDRRLHGTKSARYWTVNIQAFNNLSLVSCILATPLHYITLWIHSYGRDNTCWANGFDFLLNFGISISLIVKASISLLHLSCEILKLYLDICNTSHATLNW